MATLYKFELDGAKFSKRGLDAKIGLDRYSVPDHNLDKYRPGDRVIAIVNERGDKEVATVLHTSRKHKQFRIKTVSGLRKTIDWELAIKPLELHPSQWWRRWSTGLAAADSKNPEEFLERLNDYRWMTDRFRISFGGRVMLALGQEYTGVTDEYIEGELAQGRIPAPLRDKAALTLYNCYVGESPVGSTGYWSSFEKRDVYDDGLAATRLFYQKEQKKVEGVDGSKDSLQQFLNVLANARKEAHIMRRGGGYGINISYVETVGGAGITKDDIVVYIPETHKDYREALQRKAIEKFGVSVTVIHNLSELGPVEWFSDADVSKLGDHIMVQDSVDGMFEDMERMVRNAFAGRKTLLDFTNVRHRNAIVLGVNGRSSGAVSWAEFFELLAALMQLPFIDCVDFAEVASGIVHLIQQGGSRRGALMLVMETFRRDVLKKFIERKRELDNLGKGRWLTGSNISVGIDETFMGTVKSVDVKVRDEMSKMVLADGVDLTDENALDGAYAKAYDLVVGDPGRFGVTALEAEIYSLWHDIITSAWASAEPGVIWLERYNRMSNSWYFHEIIATNPCGEQGLPAWGVCNLAHVTLPNFWDLAAGDMNWGDLKRTVQVGIRAQDVIIDYTPYFLDENYKTQMAERRIGQGTMGLGALLVMAKIRYGKDAVQFINRLFARISFWQVEASMLLAKEKGAFPAFEADKFLASGHMSQIVEGWRESLPQDEFDVDTLIAMIRKYGVRNVTVSTQAPTGSTGTMLDTFFKELGWFDVTTGIEPFYDWTYWRAGRLGVDAVSALVTKRFYADHGEGATLPNYFVNAMSDLQPEDHIHVQAAVQRWTDSSISKTANCPGTYTVYQTHRLYMFSHDSGLKGMTIYRDGSRSAQVLATKQEDARIEAHIEAEAMANADISATTGGLHECPSCGEKKYDKANCVCYACGVSVCSF